MISLRTAIAGLAAGAALATPLTAQAAPTQTTSTAVAAVACPASQLCLYRDTRFNDMGFQTARRGQCWYLGNYGLLSHVNSYDNNLPAEIIFLNGTKNAIGSVVQWRIRAGGSSSDSTTVAGEVWVCVK